MCKIIIYNITACNKFPLKHKKLTIIYIKVGIYTMLNVGTCYTVKNCQLHIFWMVSNLFLGFYGKFYKYSKRVVGIKVVSLMFILNKVYI